MKHSEKLVIPLCIKLIHVLLILILILNPLLVNTVFAQEKLSDQQSLLVDVLSEMLGVNTTATNGNTTIAVKNVAKRLIDSGFPNEQVKVLTLDPTKGNLVVRYKGSGEKKPLLLLAHIDVVDVVREEWSFDPFKLTESEGFYYGRGSTDDKAMASIFIANLISYHNEGFKPNRDIIVCLTSDEENGGPNGIQWLLQEHRDLIDAGFCINEGGYGQIIDGKYILNEVQVAEKLYQSYQLTVKTPGGHSSLPTKNNAIYVLSEALNRLSKYEFPVHLNENTRAYFNVMSTIQDGQVASDMKAILNTPPVMNAISRLSQIPYYNALLRTTCVATMIEGGHAENALPQSAAAVVNCRILPDTPVDDVYATIENIIDNEKIEITPLWDNIPGDPSPLAPDLMDKISKVTHEIWPDVKVIPTMSNGASDGLYLRSAGIPTYGVTGIFEDINDNRAHAIDERIAKSVLFESQEFFYQLVKEICE